MRAGPLAAVVASLPAFLLAGCAPSSPDGGVDAGPVADPVFPADFEQRYTEMRDCRGSHEHELRFIRVMVDDLALPVYSTFEGEYPEGATLVKLEYDDEGCQRLAGYTAMRRLLQGASPEGGDWRWQKLDENRKVIEDGPLVRCVDCHQFHCAPPNGHFLTCAEEL